MNVKIKKTNKSGGEEKTGLVSTGTTYASNEAIYIHAIESAIRERFRYSTVSQ